MALFRALSTRRSQRGGGYDRLLDETTLGANDYASSSVSDHQRLHDDHNKKRHVHEAVLKRVTSVPASMLFGSSSKKTDVETGHLGRNNSKQKQPQQQAKKGKKSGKSIHPVFSLFERKKKMTANPDFSRYIEYLKEGGMWNKDSNSPVIYYK